MIVAPYTKHLAHHLQERYDYLMGESCVVNNKALGVIECVAVAPMDEINKAIFLHHYKESRDAIKALEYYLVPLFDVILIVKICDQQKVYTHLPLSSYVLQPTL